MSAKTTQTIVSERGRAAFRRDGGAALIVAIGILTILLIIGLTFFQMAQREMTVATNTGNQMRAELMAEGATAVAIAFLNHDLAIHPTYTSLDHAWRTYFNGAWAVGKDWTWQDVDGDGLIDPIVPTGALPLRGLPIVDLPNMPDLDPDLDPLKVDRLFTSEATADSLYYPRIDDLDPNVATELDAQTPAALKANHEFVVATRLGDSGESPVDPGVATDRFRPNQIDLWTDVDNDGDGLNDSIWIPIAADQITFLDDDGIDNNGINGIDEPGEDDGLDNDLDGLIDNPEGEVKAFLYNGAADGLDNDGLNGIDDAGEDITFLTAQLFYRTNDDNPIFDDNLIEVISLAGVGAVDVDVIDNDYNLVIGNNEVFLIDPTLPEDEDNPITFARAHYFLGDRANTNGFLSTDMVDELNRIVALPGPDYEVWGSAEPVSDIVGRMAILITDEASKVNLNAAGGHVYEEVFPAAPPPNTDRVPAIRSISDGIGVHEYDTRVLPLIGVARTRWMWQLLMGSPDGFYGNRIEEFAPFGPIVPYYNPAFEADATLPGYGFVDDNGNALWWLADGIDNDGNGFIDDGLIPHDYNNDGTDTLADKFEGIDEPQEHLKFSPLRNLVAEGTAADDDGDGVEDERGEMGDRFLRTREQSKLVNGDLTAAFVEGINATVFDGLRNLTTVHSNDRNNRYRHSTDGVNLLAPRNRDVTGLKLDYNYAMADDIAKMLREDFGFVPSVPTHPNTIVKSFALGLRQEDTDVLSGDPLDSLDPGFMFGPLSGQFSKAFPADPELRAAQLAATTKDYRDRDHARTEVTTETPDTWWVNQIGGTEKTISYTSAGVEGVRINEIMVRPVRRIEAEMDPIANPVAVGADPLLNPNGFVPQPAFPAPDFLLGVTQVGAAWSLYTANSPAVIGFDTTFSATAVYTAGGQYLSPPIFPAVPDVPNVIQFEFVPTKEMPAGRYYLTVNTQFVNDAGRRITTALRPGDIEFTTKYVRTVANGGVGDVGDGSAAVNQIRVGETDIVKDVINGVNTNDLRLVEDVWKPAIIGFGNMDVKAEGTESGWVFFPTDAARVPLGTVGSTVFDGYFQNEGYTVELLPAASNVTLQVGIRIGSGALAAGRLDINFFDFSQEPDHEWVELVNIAEGPDEVDVSGWKLVVEGPKRTVMTIPDQTFIAPNGYLLLGMNKFDNFQNGPTGTNIIYENGIGLAQTTGGFYDLVTVPPISGLIFPSSVFSPGAIEDFVDNDGDGAADGATPDDNVESTLATVFPSSNTKPFDRIVELQVSGLRGITGPESLANIILSGGIFPNYPEHDFIDNDGDNAILNEDGIDNDGDGVVDENIASNGLDDNGNNLAWITDGIDNDGDGFIDERPQSDGIDNNLDGFIDEPGEVDPVMGPDEGIDEPGETDVQGTLDDGIDEGRWAMPLVTGGGLPTDSDAPGSFSDLLIPYVTTPSGTFNAEYIGGDRDPVEWKAFVERRWYPGDNVIITLYEAAPFQEGLRRVVDRVTYTERDVVNRSVDDILSTDIGGTAALDRDPLHPDFPSYWPDDTMGIDFYKSLERKHPLYAGDRFGTQNRWQATDGNYDDWADRTSEWEREIQSDGTVTDPPTDREPDVRFNHAFSGSPLRMNLSQRYIESRNVQFNSDDGVGGTAQTYANSVRWAFEDDAPPAPQQPQRRARVRNHDLVSPANLLAAPHFRQVLDLDRVQADGQLTINESLFDIGTATVFHQDISPEEGLFGQRELITAIPTAAPTIEDTRVVTALIGAGATSAPLVLTTGQAEVFPFTPASGAYPAIAIEYSWGPPFSIPNGWTPVLTYYVPNPPPPPPLPPETFPPPTNYDSRYLLQTPGTLPGTVDDNRSPVESRAVMYASGNIVGFLQSSPHTAGNGAESFFLWDGEDGLENGEYDLYLSIGDDLSVFETAPASGLLTAFGDEFVATAAAILPEEMVVDVEVYTDRNRDGRVYDAGIVTPVLLTHLDATESFGQQHGLAPGPDGYVHYGTVRVENNVLGVMLRNRTPVGSMIRFSRVILTPRDRTPGRININTTITRNVNGDIFNGLMGLPGILARPGDGDDVTEADLILDTIAAGGAPGGVGGVDIEDLTRQIALHREIGIVGGLPAGALDVPADGRYYEFVSDLGSHRYGDNPSNAAEFDNALTSEALNASAPDVFDEMKARLERLQNLVTVRSDVFEILVTVQAGYGVDVNGDGIINYRDQGVDDPEFVVTAERTARTIYER